MPHGSQYSGTVKCGAVDVYLLCQRHQAEVWFCPEKYKFHARRANKFHKLKHSELIGVYEKASLEMLLEDLQFYMDKLSHDATKSRARQKSIRSLNSRRKIDDTDKNNAE